MGLDGASPEISEEEARSSGRAQPEAQAGPDAGPTDRRLARPAIYFARGQPYVRASPRRSRRPIPKAEQ